jgi:hypothetical protein
VCGCLDYFFFAFPSNAGHGTAVFHTFENSYSLLIQLNFSRPDIHGSVHHDIVYRMTNKMQQSRKIYCSLAALHVSSSVFAHHQEHPNCIYSLWYYTRYSMPAGFMGELELTGQFPLSHETSRQRLKCIIPEAVNTVRMLLVMSENIARNM